MNPSDVLRILENVSSEEAMLVFLAMIVFRLGGEVRISEQEYFDFPKNALLVGCAEDDGCVSLKIKYKH